MSTFVLTAARFIHQVTFFSATPTVLFFGYKITRPHLNSNELQNPLQLQRTETIEGFFFIFEGLFWNLNSA